ncbi:MAG TPA: glycosyltransferase [Solirubrobacteraceae bacterium]|nr:glycosyltransferase [Solirubrobacteraceae bacterium]
MDALIVSNMRAEEAHPARGCFVRDQVAALREQPDLDVELFEFPPGARALAAAPVQLRRRYGRRRFDIVHAHFGLSAYPALAVRARARALTVHGTDVRHPRTGPATRLVAWRMDIVAAVSQELAGELPTDAVLPCGVNLERFRPLPRAQARRELGLDPAAPCLLFPADPARAVKRFDRAAALADSLEVPLLRAGDVPPERMPLLINAANAVLVPSDQEGFGLAVVEALACEVPVLATAVGVHPLALEDLPGTLCAPFELHRWRDALVPLVLQDDPRVDARSRAQAYSSVHMAERVHRAWRRALTPGLSAREPLGTLAPPR